MHQKIASIPIPDRAIATSVHSRMRADGASHYELGLFYKAMLMKRLWSTHRDLAESLGVSRSNVSKAIALTRIPTEVVETLGGPKQISFRIGELLLDTIDKTGERVFINRARDAGRLGYTEIEEFFEFVVLDRIPKCIPNKVRVGLTRDKRSLRVQISNLDQLLPHLSQLETFISRCFIMFEAELASNTAATVERSRRRIRTDAPSSEVGTGNVKLRRQDQGGSVDAE